MCGTVQTLVAFSTNAVSYRRVVSRSVIVTDAKDATVAAAAVVDGNAMIDNHGTNTDTISFTSNIMSHEGIY